jgi:putative Holliday junction resolvase
MGRVLAIDPGTKRVGIAVSDPLGMTAQPVGFVEVDEGLEASLGNLVVEWGVEAIVVGLPLNLDGSEGAAADEARRLAKEVAASTGLETEMYDERFTTVIAERAMIEGGVRRKRRRTSRDGVAAAIILQSYLDSRR